MTTPRTSYRWVPYDDTITGYFCIFTDEFLLPTKGGMRVEELPIFQTGAHAAIQVSEAESAAVEAIFQKMVQEMACDYAYKYDLLRTYLVELIHRVQKYQPGPAPSLATGFAELLERQFPLDGPAPHPRLRTAQDYADQLAVHIVHLNRVLKEATGHTTTTLLRNRLAQQAKLLLREPTLNVPEVADQLGFTEVAYFCTFFKRQTGLTPGDYRG